VLSRKLPRWLHGSSWRALGDSDAIELSVRAADERCEHRRFGDE
jgi:hypothetical protein